jgi:hypothetical protein
MVWLGAPAWVTLLMFCGRILGYDVFGLKLSGIVLRVFNDVLGGFCPSATFLHVPFCLAWELLA